MHRCRLSSFPELVLLISLEATLCFILNITAMIWLMHLLLNPVAEDRGTYTLYHSATKGNSRLKNRIK